MDVKKDIIDKVSEAVASKQKRAVGKAKEMAEIAALKNQVAACEEVVRKNYIEIGRRVVAEYKKSGEAGFSEGDQTTGISVYEKQCKAVVNAQAGISDLKRRINEVKKRNNES